MATAFKNLVDDLLTGDRSVEYVISHVLGVLETRKDVRDCSLTPGRRETLAALVVVNMLLTTSWQPKILNTSGESPEILRVKSIVDLLLAEGFRPDAEAFTGPTIPSLVICRRLPTEDDEEEEHLFFSILGKAPPSGTIPLYKLTSECRGECEFVCKCRDYPFDFPNDC